MSDRSVLFENAAGLGKGYLQVVPKGDRLVASGFVSGPSGFPTTITINTSSGNIDVVATAAGSNLSLTAFNQIILTGTTIVINCDFNANTHFIHNVIDPVAAQDAATKNYVDTSSNNTAYIKKDGTVAFTGDESMGGNKLTLVGAPTLAGDATNKLYVDTQEALDVRLDGSRPMTGALDLGTHAITNVVNPSSAQDAATKNYVDTQEALDLRLDGSRPMTAALNMGTHLINNVVNPVAAEDAATKNYVDGLVAGASGPLTFLHVAVGTLSTTSGVAVDLPTSTFSFTLTHTRSVLFDISTFSALLSMGQPDSAMQAQLLLRDTDAAVTYNVQNYYLGGNASGNPAWTGTTDFGGNGKVIISLAAGTHHFKLQTVVSGTGATSINFTYPLNIVVTDVGP